jgi:ATPase subunit of ABC transporter with duplicated ATPase domains
MSIVVKSLTYVHPDRETLFENINFSVARGDRAALVGNNGVGKSTLLQVIAGRLQPTAGEIITSDAVLYIPQHLGQYDQLSISEALRVDKKT